MKFSKFCEVCGAKTVKEKVDHYDPESGEAVYAMVCPKDPCGHGSHDDEWIPNGFWANLFGAPDVVCRRCGLKQTTYTPF